MKTLLRYSALVFGLVFGLLLLLMSLDSFESGISLKAIVGFLIHIIPGVLVILCSLLGYYRPKFGFFVWLVISVVFTLFFHSYRNIQNFMFVSLPPIIITMLLFVSSRKHDKEKAVQPGN